MVHANIYLFCLIGIRLNFFVQIIFFWQNFWKKKVQVLISKAIGRTDYLAFV